MSLALAGKVALVTGAGRGIGRAVALSLGRAGAHVVLVARTEAQLREVASTIEREGGRGSVVVLDITANGASAEVAARAEAAASPIDILVNAAGISPTYAPAEHVTSADWDAVLRTNLTAPFLLCQAVGAGMLDRGSGTIVNVASIGALVALPRLAAYCAAKSGLVSITRVLAIEWAARGVRVNAVAPSFVRTDMTDELLSHPKHGPEIVGRTPLGRNATADEVAAAVLYLASDSARFVTGQTLCVDGGWTAQ
jgi:NAD(P)-dependent dehydrogenase (short-subunit alcohol dehydrogenase family)